MISYLNNKLISFEKERVEKDALLQKMVNDIGENSGIEIDTKEVYDKIIGRENIGTIGIGRGIAVPHARCESISDVAMAITILEKPIEFNAPDGEKVNVVIMIIAPKEKNNEYLGLLSNISKNFRDTLFRSEFVKSKAVEDVIELMVRYTEGEI